MNYLIVVQAPAYAVTPTSFATESAFAEHLRELRRSLGSKFDRIVLLSPSMQAAEFDAKRQHLSLVDLDRDGVAFVPAHQTDASALEFWRSVRSLWRRVWVAVQQAGIVHSGMSSDVWRPLMALANLAGWLQKRPVVFVVDIDFRLNAVRSRQLGLWSIRSYVINRSVYDPLKWLQVWLAPRMFQLVLLKSASMVEDFGRGRENVRNFYDTVHSAADVLQAQEARARLVWLAEPGRALELAFFGRFVRYKGLERAIEAVRLARAMGADVRLRLIGDGECEAALRQQVAEASLAAAVTFEGPLPYGPQLFERMRTAHVCIATPLLEDTPRAAFDAMARGLPILAFDISYFRDLARDSGAVMLAAWPDAKSVADKLLTLNNDRRRLSVMAQRGLDFAAQNTQSVWLDRRLEWVEELAAR